MSRPLRIQYPGAWYHVMNRGLNRRCIFQDDEHRKLFYDLLKDIYARYGVQTHAYCLMGNHYHLILHTPKANLSRAMRHLDGVYTQRFNRKMKRDGPLFRGRYKAILMEEDQYLLQLSRYIHLNPVTAKVCAKAQDCDEVLGRCSQKKSIKAYREFVEEGVDETTAQIFSKMKMPSLLGSEKWIEEIKNDYLAEIEDDEEIPELKYLQRDDNIYNLLENVAVFYGVSLNSLKQRGHRHLENLPRNILIYLAAEHYGYDNKFIARIVEGISGAGVSKIRKRMEEKLKNNKELQKELGKLKEIIV
jgi:putative transposase